GSAILILVLRPSARANLSQTAVVGTIYGTIFLLGLSRGIYSPAASSLKAFLVPRALYPNSSTWVSTFWQAGAILGPASGGFLYAISLDMFSVLFGGVVAILPIFAQDILNVGPEGLGMLRAAPSIGALLTLLVTAYWHPARNHAWRNLLWSVAGFGVATLVFAV